MSKQTGVLISDLFLPLFLILPKYFAKTIFQKEKKKEKEKDFPRYYKYSGERCGDVFLKPVIL